MIFQVDYADFYCYIICMEQRIHIVEEHHQVLTFWAELRRELPEAPQVWSLDYHTDTMPCFRGKYPEPEKDDFKSPEKVAAAVAKLRHDEHFDWALRAGVASAVHLGICGGETDIIAHPAISVRRAPELPPPETILNSPGSARSALENFLSDESLLQMFPRLPQAGESYILDIDCDCILCWKTLFPEDNAVWKKLLKNAALITLSMESDWVKILKLPGETITGAEIAGILRQTAAGLHFSR